MMDLDLAGYALERLLYFTLLYFPVYNPHTHNQTFRERTNFIVIIVVINLESGSGKNKEKRHCIFIVFLSLSCAMYVWQ